MSAIKEKCWFNCINYKTATGLQFVRATPISVSVYGIIENRNMLHWSLFFSKVFLRHFIEQFNRLHKQHKSNIQNIILKLKLNFGFYYILNLCSASEKEKWKNTRLYCVFFIECFRNPSQLFGGFWWLLDSDIIDSNLKTSSSFCQDF